MEHSVIHNASVVLIFILYVVFACQVFFGLPKGAWRKPALRPLFALVSVFAFCATTGYLSTLLPPGYEALRDALHVVLVLVSVWLALSNQAGVIAKALSRD